jgi:hypothetical protein
VAVEQDLTCLSPGKITEEQAEWQERQRLSAELSDRLEGDDATATAAVRELLDPYWGFGAIKDPVALARVLRGRRLADAG